MKHAYSWARPLLAALWFGTALGAQAQQAWRPFRPGLIYAYKASANGSNPNNLIYTLRVDSAYATASGDSVYAFNRLLRPASTALLGSVKSRNNLFGAQLRWRPGQASYTLEALAQTNVQTAISLTLFPRAAVGSTWNASSQPLRTATLVSRSLQIISPGVQDTVAVISITDSGVVSTVRLSRTYGLQAAPQWLGGATGSPLEQAVLPARFENSLYSPAQLFNVLPGDEFGYQEYDLGMSPVRCSDYKILRRILSKRLTADSLIVRYQEQSRYESFGWVGYCYPAQVTYSPVTVKQWALALAGNRWLPTGPALQPGALRLLTGEYVDGAGPGPGPSSYLLVGKPISSGGATGICPSSLLISYVPYYLQSGTTPAVYRTGVDLAAWQYNFSQGMTTTSEMLMQMIYSRKSVNGTTQICGDPLGFVNLLPTRAAAAAAIATLAPNPAAEAATLTLAQPARAGHYLHLTDALGRTVWRTLLAPGQTSVPVPLAGQPAGLYLLHLSGPDAGAATWKLIHE